MRLKVKVQLYCGNEIAMGPGKADLLDAVGCQGSISAAARAMRMSYRRAWLLVDCMNRCWQHPLVRTAPGATHGAGARVTPFGQEVLAHYRALQAVLDGASTSDTYKALTAALCNQPRSKG